MSPLPEVRLPGCSTQEGPKVTPSPMHQSPANLVDPQLQKGSRSLFMVFSLPSSGNTHVTVVPWHPCCPLPLPTVAPQ